MSPLQLGQSKAHGRLVEPEVRLRRNAAPPLPRPPGWPNATSVERFLEALRAPPGHLKPRLTAAEIVEQIDGYLDAARGCISAEERLTLLKARAVAQAQATREPARRPKKRAPHASSPA